MPRSNVDIFQFLDYRTYLRAFYDAEKAASSSFSFRAFSMRAGVASPNHLKRIMDGERSLKGDLVERYAKVLNELADAGAKILISHAPNEQVEADAVIKASGRDYPTNAGLDLGTLKAVYEKAALVLTNDTGPRHIGVALGRPVICVMGPNDPRYTALPGVELGEVIREPVDCTPYSWPCQLKECPIDHRCMDAISVERVLNACRRVLGRS